MGLRSSAKLLLQKLSNTIGTSKQIHQLIPFFIILYLLLWIITRYSKETLVFVPLSRPRGMTPGRARPPVEPGDSIITG